MLDLDLIADAAMAIESGDTRLQLEQAQRMKSLLGIPAAIGQLAQAEGLFQQTRQSREEYEIEQNIMRAADAMLRMGAGTGDMLKDARSLTDFKAAQLLSAEKYKTEMMGHQTKQMELANKQSRLLIDRKSTRLNSSHSQQSRMPSSA